MLEAAAQPCRAGRVLAAPDDLVFVALQLAAAVRHVVGITHGTESAGRRLRIGATTRGITSPAFSMITMSPSRRSLRARSSALWSVAIEMVDPARNTGSRTA